MRSKLFTNDQINGNQTEDSCFSNTRCFTVPRLKWKSFSVVSALFRSQSFFRSFMRIIEIVGERKALASLRLTLAPRTRSWAFESQAFSRGRYTVKIQRHEKKNKTQDKLFTVSNDGTISGINSIQMSFGMNSMVFWSIEMADWFIGYFACSMIGLSTLTVCSAGRYSAAAWAACSAERVI